MNHHLPDDPNILMITFKKGDDPTDPHYNDLWDRIIRSPNALLDCWQQFASQVNRQHDEGQLTIEQHGQSLDAVIAALRNALLRAVNDPEMPTEQLHVMVDSMLASWFLLNDQGK